MSETGRELTRTMGRRLRAARLARGLSMTRLAALTGGGLSVSSISHYELGKRRLGIEMAQRLAAALGTVSAAHLLCLDKSAAGERDPREERLLAAFRALDDEGRRRVLKVAGCVGPGEAGRGGGG